MAPWRERRDYLRHQIETYRRLEHRSACPCCDQKIDWEEYNLKIPDLEEKLKMVLDELELLYPKIKELMKIEIEAKQLQQKIKTQQIEKYLQQNRNKLNKAIRDYHKGVKNYLPSIPNSEKKTWNDAMELQLDKRGLDDNDELLFDL